MSFRSIGYINKRDLEYSKKTWDRVLIGWLVILNAVFNKSNGG